MNIPKSHGQSESSAKSIDLLAVLRRRWGIVLWCSIIGIAVAGVYCAVAQKIHESTAEILVFAKDAGLASRTTAPTDESRGLDSTLADEILATHLHIIQSPANVGTALDSGDFLKLESLVAELPPDVVKSGDAEALKRAAIGYVRSNLEVKRGGESETKGAQVLSVAFRHSSDTDGANILAAIIESYRNFIDETVQGVGGEAVALIREAQTDLEQQVREHDKTYSDFVRNSPLVASLDGTTVNPHAVRLQELEAELSRLQIEETGAKARLAQVEQVIKKDDIGMEDLAMLDKADVARLGLLMDVERNSPTQAVAGEFARMMALKEESVKSSAKLGPNHPKNRELQASLEGLSSNAHKGMTAFDSILIDDGISTRRLADAYAEMLRNDIRGFEESERVVFALVENEKEAGKLLVDTELQQQRYFRQLERAESLYDVVVDRLGELNLLNNYAGFTNAILKPVEPGYQVWPNLPLLLAAGLCLGGLLGVGIGFVTEVKDQSFRTPTDIEQELRTPVLGQVPAIDLFGSQLIDRIIDRSIATYHQPRSAEAERVRKLRSVLFFRTQDLDHSVIQVTSPNAGDGASTLIGNLAVAIAQAGKRVLLVDANLRAPKIGKLFGIQSDMGLTKFVQGDERMEDVIHMTGIPNLAVIPAGEPTPDAAELILRPEFQNLLNCVREEYDYVLVDTPPAMTTSDPLVTSAHVDGVLLCLKLTPEARTASRQTLGQFDDNGAVILGVVVNEFAMNNFDSKGFISEYRFVPDRQHEDRSKAIGVNVG